MSLRTPVSSSHDMVLTRGIPPHSEDRVRKGAEKLSKFLNAKQQGRLDGFFTVQPKAKEPPATKGKGSTKGKDAKSAKRKVSFHPTFWPIL